MYDSMEHAIKARMEKVATYPGVCYVYIYIYIYIYIYECVHLCMYVTNVYVYIKSRMLEQSSSLTD
jgi:hypothetical protein